MARYYLNRGIILEQVIVSLIHSYLEAIDTDNLYSNFHIEATNRHPFANLYLHSNERAADTFPAIVVTTATDDKTPALNLQAWVSEVGFDESDIDTWASDTYGEDFTDLNGNTVKAGTKIPGLCAVTSADVKNALKEIAKKQGYVYGDKIVSRRTDRISVEIWADNEQVKNEIYEILRLFFVGDLPRLVCERYGFFDPLIDDSSVHGQRSNNYNMDFDVPLSGAMITFEVNYAVAQIVFDTEKQKINQEIITEATNYVK